jgi:hypothetical protein
MLMKSSVDPTLLLESVESTKGVMPMQSLVDPTPLLGGDAPLDHIVLQYIQPVVEKVVAQMQSLIDPTLLLESLKSKKVVLLMQCSSNPTLLMGSDVSTDYVSIISSSIPSEQGGIRSKRISMATHLVQLAQNNFWQLTIFSIFSVPELLGPF